MKLYISGPITGTEDYMERFNRAEQLLTAAGHTVINPARVNAALPGTTSYGEYMEMSFTMLEMCECIFLLRGWKKSRGARQELKYAAGRGYTIAFEGGRGCHDSQNIFSSAGTP